MNRMQEDCLPPLLLDGVVRQKFMEDHHARAILVLKTKEYSLYSCNEAGVHLRYYAIANGELAYFMNLVFTDIRYLNSNEIAKVLVGSVWRTAMSPMYGLANLPKSLFWTILNRGHTIVSDPLDSQMNETFWFRRLCESVGGLYEAAAINLQPDGIVADGPISIVGGTQLTPFYGRHKQPNGPSWRFCIRKP